MFFKTPIHHILLLFIILINLSYQEDIPLCCCFFTKDPFRGFQITHNQILQIKKTGLDKAELASMMMNICIGTKGFPTIENIERLKRNNFVLSKEKCDKECFYLTRQLNDNYTIKQEKNRNNEAKRLQQYKKSLENKINSQIKLNVESLNKGGSCKIRIISHTKESGYAAKMLNNAMANNKREQKVNDNDNDSLLSFDSVSLPSHHSIDNPELEEALRAYDDQDTNNFSGIKLDYNTYKGMNDNKLETNSEILQEIDELELQIMYLEKKNTKPIDFILERFNIKDNILVMIIKIFEKTLDEVLSNMKTDMDDTIYFQFKVIENSKHKQGSI